MRLNPFDDDRAMLRQRKIYWPRSSSETSSGLSTSELTTAFPGRTRSEFALDGARGLCLEPVRETFTKLRWLYLLNDRVTTVKLGVSDQDERQTS